MPRLSCYFEEEWNDISIKSMQAWLKTVEQAVKRRRGEDFNFDVMEYFRFEQAMAGSD